MKISKILTLLVVFVLTGCRTLEIGIEHNTDNTPTAPSVKPDEPYSSTPSLQPSPTTTQPIPADTLIPATATQTAPTLTSTPQWVEIYLIALEDNGQSGQPVGCGDSVIPVKVSISPTQEVLRASIEELLALKEPYYGESGLYSALHQSDLQLESISLENGKAVIYLKGTLLVGGVCDNPRIEAQLEATALQYPTVHEVLFIINGIPLADVLSLKD